MNDRPCGPMSRDEYQNEKKRMQARFDAVRQSQDFRFRMYRRPLSVRGLFIATALAIVVGGLIGLVLR